MIKAILFDVDGVLLDSFEANLKFFGDLLQKFGYRAPSREEYFPHFGSNMRNIIRDLGGIGSEEEIHKIWVAGKEREVPYPSDMIVMPKHMDKVVEFLAESYSLGIVTSRLKAGVFEMPQLKSLEEYFKTLVSYEDTEKHKPYPDPLILAAKRLKIKPEEAVYVGDTEYDLTAARSAGMKAVMYGLGGVDGADGYAKSFVELPDIIEGLKD